jgi:putative membrane protein
MLRSPSATTSPSSVAWAMPSEPRRLHGFTVVSRAMRLARQILLPAVLGGASVGGDFRSVLLWGFVLLAVPSIVIATAQWLAFRFRLQGDELIMDSGVFARRRRVIPIDRVQNVDLAQTALERLAGVAELRIETAAGGQDTEASLAVLSEVVAREVQADLLARRATARATRIADRAADPSEPATEPVGQRLLRLSPFDLALAGATSNEAGLIAAGLATLLEVVGRFGALEGLAVWVEEAAGRGAPFDLVGTAAAIALLVLAFLILGWLVSIVVTVVHFHGFTLTRIGDDLRREYGLLSRHQTTVPIQRVQALRIEETLPRRALGLVTLKIETAGASPQERRRIGEGAEAYVPLARRRDMAPLLRAVFEDARFDGVELHPVAPPSRRREFVRLALFVAAATAGATVYGTPRPFLLLGLLLPAWFLARARYRARGWARAAGYTFARHGVLTRITWIVPERKIQTLHLTETPFQRRWGLATIIPDTAAGGRVARVVDLYRTTATSLLADLAHGAETARIRAAADAPTSLRPAEHAPTISSPDSGPGPR